MVILQNTDPRQELIQTRSDESVSSVLAWLSGGRMLGAQGKRRPLWGRVTHLATSRGRGAVSSELPVRLGQAPPPTRNEEDVSFKLLQETCL